MIIKRNIIICGLLLILCCMEDIDAKRIKKEKQIINGFKAPKKKFKWMARVMTPTTYCGGTLVTVRHVVTAGHCVSAYTADKLDVILGDHRYFINDKTEQKRKVKSYYIYDDNDANQNNDFDVAILVLSKAAKLNKAVSYILLTQELPPVNSICTLSGWGRTIGNVAAPAKILQYINYPTASHTDCKNDQANFDLKPWQLCVGRPFGDYVGACHGDSGSPLVYPNAMTKNSKPRLIGFPYGGAKDCPSGLHYRIFASIPALYDWIVDKIGCSLPGTWQTWSDVDNPNTDQSDNETYTATTRPCGKGKMKPICMEKKIVSKKYCRKPYKKCANSKNQRLNWHVSFGLSCVNANQKIIRRKRCKCCDYAVRYKCPT